jgi:integrase
LQIQGKTLKEELLEKLREDPEVNKNTIESITHKFIDRWNHKGNFSEFERIHDSKNSQTNYIHQVKALEEAVIKYEPEVVEDSPFDFDQIQQWSLMKTQIEDLKNYIQNASDENSETLQLLVEDQTRKLGQQIKDLSGQIDSVSDDVKSLLPKPKRKHEPQELRDPITQETFQVLMINAGSLAKNQKDIRRAQLRITYTVLYYVGLRLNELQPLELQTLQNAIKEKELKITLFKTNRCHNFILSEQAIRALEALEEEFFILTKVYQFKYLFGKRTPIHRKSLLRLVNQDLANTCERYKISGNIKSHSFRISLIARLLKVTYVQQVAEIMGHQDIRSTMKYKRYRVGKDDIRKLYQSAERIN